VKKICFLAVCLAVLLSITGMASPDTLKVTTQVCFQVGFNHPSENFSLPFSRVDIKGFYGTRWSGQVELRATDGNSLYKAYIDYRFRPYCTIRTGQFANPFKSVELSRDQQYIPFFAIYEQYVANGDDIGLAIMGTVSRWAYSLCVINGTGKNVPDNNCAKDVVGYVSCKLPLTTMVQLCWQAGAQPDAWRSGGFVRMSGDPSSVLHWEAAYATRRDLHREGWYALAAIGRKIQLTARLHRPVQDDPLAWTVGLQGLPVKIIKLQSAVVMAQGQKLQAAMVVQLNLIIHGT
jgi:hypothetical protein